MIIDAAFETLVFENFTLEIEILVFENFTFNNLTRCDTLEMSVTKRKD